MDTAGAHVGDVLISGFIMLGAALILVLLFRKFGIGAVLGYLIAGVLIGPPCPSKPAFPIGTIPAL